MISLTPKNWSEFQHYKDRSPAWIKLHRSLLDDYEFACLPVASRALAPLLWLLASEFDDGTIKASVEKLAFRFRMAADELRIALKPLIDGGFFALASGVLAECKHDAIPEKKEEEEKQEEKRENIRAVGKPTRPYEADEDFKKFWEVYPRRGGANPKVPAWKAFGKSRKVVDPAEIIAAAGQYAAAESKNIGTPHIAQAVTWLNQSRWVDYPPPSIQMSRKIFVKAETKQWRAWSKYLGKEPPTNRDYGWFFDSEWPPQQAA